MEAHIEAVEKNIDALGPSGLFEKHNVKFNVSDLEEVPYSDFAQLQHDLVDGHAIVRLSTGGNASSGIFSLFASPVQKRLVTSIALSSYVAAVLGIGLAVFGAGWWWLLTMLAPIVAMRRGKRIYSEALFRAIGTSEKAFCFAFCGNAITLETTDGAIRARGKPPL